MRKLLPLFLGCWSALLQMSTCTPVMTSVDDCDPNLTFHTHEVSHTRLSNSINGNSITHESQIDGSSRQECFILPKVPAFSKISCNTGSGSCQATCQTNYQFPNGENTMYLTCENGNWKVQGADWAHLPACKPICQQACQNEGVCVAPNRCACQADFTGNQCQFEDKQCNTFPKTPMNSRKHCSSRNCTMKCLQGAQFPGGATEAEFLCRNGNWVTRSNFKWDNIPGCDFVCDPPCQNSGKCLPSNRCLCPTDYRGLQCQHSRDRCSMLNMQFNGSRMCNGTSEYFTCAIHCPQGMSFTFPPAPRYTCYYETGVFLPANVPQCQFGQRYVAESG